MSRADSPLAGALVFVVGAQRSGTNWLQALLALHPSVVAIPSETALFSHGIAHLEERVQDGLISSTKTGRTYMSRDAFLDAARDFCDAIFSGLRASLDPAATRVVERTPMHVRHLRLIADVYPDAKVVHLIRDGRDVALSLLAQSWGPATARAAAEEWVAAVRSGRGAGIAAYREVRHEELTADPVGVVAGILDWLGLAVDDALRAAIAERAPRAVNVTAANPTTVPDKWRRAAATSDLVDIEAVAGPLLRELGYAEHADLDDVPAAGPVAPASRRRVGRSRRSAGRTGTAPAASTSTSTSASTSAAEDLQEQIDVLVSGLQRSDATRIATTLTETCVIEVNGRELAGADRAAALLHAVVSHADLVQVRGAAHPGLPSSTVHLALRAPDGREVIESLVLVRDEVTGRFRKVIYLGPTVGEHT